MKIWFTEIGEPLPIEEDVRLHRYGSLTLELARLGHDVTWFTSSWSHSRKLHLRDRDSDEVCRGVRLRILRGPGYQRNVSLQRIRHQAHFAGRFYRVAKAASIRPDIIVSPVPTIEVAGAAVRYGLESGVPVVVDIRDQWPEEFVDLFPKPLRGLGRVALHPMFVKMRNICRSADGIVGVSRSFMEYGLTFSGRREGPSDAVIPIGYNADALAPERVAAARNAWLEMGVRPEAFIGCFFGTIGRFFDLDTVIDAARVLASESDCQFVLCGGGSGLEKYRQAARDVPSVIFPGWVDAPRISALMQMSKVGLAPYVRGARMGLPNKPFEYFAGELPVVSSLTGELKDLLAQYHCGLTYSPDSVESLCAALRQLQRNPSAALDMGQEGRRLLESRFSTVVIARTLDAYLRRVASDYSARRQGPAPER